jgi:phage-related protein
VPTQAVYFRDAEGRQPVSEFLRSAVSTRGREIIEVQIGELNGLPDNLPPLPFPQSSQIEGSLRELRCHVGSSLFRILYRRSGNLFVLLHMIRKDSQVVPRRDIEVAQKRWREFKRRMDSTERRGPRAVGRDAP